MKNKFKILVMFLTFLTLTGCVTSIITAPVKLAVGTTKVVTKATYKTIKYVVTDNDKEKKNEE